ncbi:hypothetical protein AGLY_017700 [Aphis glycines]|uniref:HAT C-terminal dimerisation domain-containing protein n=1 Tax=Aphis glycines TaxID=307491 RepID=A0A6G0SU54_APHGL|nr:hypothetical protein AGLY_017700 [Aphis glycines]
MWVRGYVTYVAERAAAALGEGEGENGKGEKYFDRLYFLQLHPFHITSFNCLNVARYTYLKNYIVTTTTSSEQAQVPSVDLHKNVDEFGDCQFKKKHFSTESLKMANAVDNSLKLYFVASLLFIEHYKIINIDNMTLKSEMLVVKNSGVRILGQNDISIQDLKNIVNAEVYPNLFKLVKVGLTIPISSATWERSFSTMRRIKT